MQDTRKGGEDQPQKEYWKRYFKKRPFLVLGYTLAFLALLLGGGGVGGGVAFCVFCLAIVIFLIVRPRS